MRLRAMDAALAIVGYSRANPAQAGQLYVLGVLPFVVMLVSIPAGMLLGVLMMILLPPAWWRLCMQRADVQGGFLLRFSWDEGRTLLAMWLVHVVATAATMIVGVGAMMLEFLNPSVGVFSMTVVTILVPVLVWARLGPGLALGIAERTFLVTRSWKPTGEIGWRVYACWLPFAMILLAPWLTVAIRGEVRADPVTDPSPWLILLLGVVWSGVLPSACATHAYVARYIQQSDAADIDRSNPPSP